MEMKNIIKKFLNKLCDARRNVLGIGFRSSRDAKFTSD